MCPAAQAKRGAVSDFTSGLKTHAVEKASALSWVSGRFFIFHLSIFIYFFLEHTVHHVGRRVYVRSVCFS